MARTITIRRSLLINLVFLIVAFSGIIFAMTFLAARHAVRGLSATVMKRTIDQTEVRLRRFFDPPSRELQVARAWGEAGLLDNDQPDHLTALFEPVIKQYPQISSLMVANSRGHEYMLLRTADQWLVRQTRRDQWNDLTRWHSWSDDYQQAEKYTKRIDYDPRRRPWYEGATAMKGDDLYWSSPYTFYTTKEPGITASVTYDGGDGLDHVIGFDVLLKDITAFTMNLEVSAGGKVIVLTDDRRIIGLPRDEKYAAESDRNAALLKKPLELGEQLVVDAKRAHDGQQDPGQPLRFRSGGQAWWGQVKTFSLSPQRTLRIVVMIPEVDLLGGVSRMRSGILFTAAVVLAVGIFRAIAMARRYSRPIEALVRESDHLSRLQLHHDEHIDAPVREIEQLSEAQDRMRAALQSFSRYLPTELVRELVMLGEAAQIGGKTEKLTVLFTDIENFTPIAESMEPAKLTEHLADYFENMLLTLRVHRATIDKLVGDAVMAFWGAPLVDEFHAVNAINAVLACSKRLDELNEQWRGAGKPVLPTRFGLASGKVMVGNVGSRSRLSYTAIGDTVNLASRLEPMNRQYGTRILAAESVRDACDDQFQWRLVDRIAVRGKRRAVNVYEPLGRSGEVDQGRLDFARRYEQAWQAYAEQRFGDALQTLANLRDEPSVNRLRQQCERFEREAPPADWDAVAITDPH